MPQWTILDVLKWTTGYFSANLVDTPRLTAEILLAEVLGIDRIGLYIRFDQPLSEDERDRFRALVKRRTLGEPVAYILGRKDFWKINLAVTPDVLIPRPETEILVEAALEMMPAENRRPPARVIDMGTGSGAIVISLAHARPDPLYFASDISPAALRVAAGNAVLNNVADRISFFSANWFQAVSPACSFDMILSNPPYVPSGELGSLAPEIFGHEPFTALDGDADGLRDIAALVAESPKYLVPGGVLVMEIGHDQRAAVAQMAENRSEWKGVVFRRDYAGHDRIAILTTS